MDDKQRVAMMKGQALAASDVFDIGASADPDVILAANAKLHIIWLIERLQTEQVQAAKWRLCADVLAGRMAHHATCPDHADLDPGCPFCRDVAAYQHYIRAGGTVRPPRSS